MQRILTRRFAADKWLSGIYEPTILVDNEIHVKIGVVYDQEDANMGPQRWRIASKTFMHDAITERLGMVYGLLF